MKRAIKQFAKALIKCNPLPVGKGESRKLVPILRYHSVDATGSCISTTDETWRRHLGFFRQHDLQVVSLRDFFARSPEETEGILVLTFDDGYQNNYERAFCDLKELGYSATFFIVPDYVGKQARWIERDLSALLDEGEEYLDESWETFESRARLSRDGIRKYLPQMLRLDRQRLLLEFYHLNKVKNLALMTWEKVRQMSRSGMDIGAHTLTHCHFCDLDEVQAREEIHGSKTAIEEQIGTEVQYFCYPYGNIPNGIPSIVREAGFVGACSCEAGFHKKGQDPFSLKRIEMEAVTTLFDVDFLLNARHRVLVDKLSDFRRKEVRG